MADIVHSFKGVTLPLLLKKAKRGTITIKCEEMNQSSGDLVCKLQAQDLKGPVFMKLFNILCLFVACFLYFLVRMRRTV